MKAGPNSYRQTVIGPVPDDWEVGSLEQFWSVTDCKHVTAQFVVSGYAVASIKEVQSRLVDLTYANRTTEQYYNLLTEGARKPRSGDLILSRNATVGEVAQVTGSHPPFAMGQDVCLLRKKSSRYSTNFLQSVLRSPIIANQLSDLMVGSTFKRANVQQIKNFVVVMPKPEEQEAIAEALGDADALIESLEQLVAKKRHLKQAAMQQLLTGKTRLPGFTGVWTSCEMGDVFKISGGLSASRDQLSNEGICYLHYGDIHGSTKSYIDVEREHQTIPKLDVALNKVSPSSLLSNGDIVFVDASEDVDGTNKHVVIANPCNKPFISGLHTIVAKQKGNDLVPLYCRYCFQTEDVKRQFRFFAVGSKVSGVSKTNIKKIELVFPSSKEQFAIAEILTDMESEIAELEAKLSKSRQIKQGMMQELLTGRTRLI